jgi:tRNA(fMet)-specific endonuclease VapC
MNAIMVDTNVASYILKADSRAALYEKHIRHKSIAVSFVTVGELYEWSRKPGHTWGARRLQNLHDWLGKVIIVPYDNQVCSAYADLAYLVTTQGSPRNIPANDRWIAACAIRHAIPLASHNRRDFENIPNLVLISEAPPVLLDAANT